LDIAPPDMASDDLQFAIVRAQEDLAKAGASPYLRGDPYRFIMAALSAVLGVFGRSIRRFEKAVSDIIAARSPITANDKAAITEAMENGAYKAVKQEVRRLTRSLDLKQSKEVGLYVAGMLLVGLVVGIGLDRWVLSRPDFSGMHCAEQSDHSRVCWFEVVPAPPAPQATQGRH
jgi:hypothetical protein